MAHGPWPVSCQVEGELDEAQLYSAEPPPKARPCYEHREGTTPSHGVLSTRSVSSCEEGGFEEESLSDEEPWTGGSTLEGCAGSMAEESYEESYEEDSTEEPYDHEYEDDFEVHAPQHGI